MYQMIQNEVVYIKEVNHLFNTFLFMGMSCGEKEEIADRISPFTLCYEKGDLVYGDVVNRGMIGFVIEGECEVRRMQPDGSYVPLNRIAKYSSFGIISVFSEQSEYPTRIYARRHSKVTFLCGIELLALAEKYTKVSMNIIRFLSERIAFLNDKIATFSGNTVEDKLASYILVQRKRYAKDSFRFIKSNAADVINCGRASVYRALDALCNAGYISLNQKNITINDPEGLERILK